MSDEPEIRIEQQAPDKFSLNVLFEGRNFDCGNYISRVAALQAGRLFAERKKGEAESRRKRPRGRR